MVPTSVPHILTAILTVQWYSEANAALGESGVEASWFPRMVASSNCEFRDDTELLLTRSGLIMMLVLSLSLQVSR